MPNSEYSPGRLIILVLLILVVLIITKLPYNINDYLEVFMIIVAFMSIQVLGERIDRIIKGRK